MEWKLPERSKVLSTGIVLGNFLSGMETQSRRVPPRAPPPLETSLVEGKQGYEKAAPITTPPLGNFLSGMETALKITPLISRTFLGNFLSGMETLLPPAAPRSAPSPLETSLVEWKQDEIPLLAGLRSPLETSLVEWKQSFWEIHAFTPATLETSLVEWKRFQPLACDLGPLLPW